MSPPLVSAALLLLLLPLLSALEAWPAAATSRIPAARPPAPPPPHGQSRGYVALRLPASSRKRHQGFRGREAEGCLPRGVRPPPSAPSRYVNYHTFGSDMCSPATTGKGAKP
ncbi:hypothetical protein Taro_038091 [Colocasia esculenta]|uniref:Uncharacterized protein n=1 Tax=Colocasia esculenta TaxID=4460 RepID=A0A843W5S1_COLES|nr:hypothetical protein [Colocasia esculenta]